MATARRDVIVYPDDGMWPARSDDPEWVALLADTQTREIDGAAATAVAATDLDAVLAEPRYALEELDL